MSKAQEQKLGTCDVARHAKGWVTIAPGVRHQQLEGCVNWREFAQPSPAQTDEEACGQPAASFIPRWGMSFACALPKGHKGEHRQGGNCFKHGRYVGEQCPKWPDCIPVAAQPEAGEPHYKMDVNRTKREESPECARYPSAPKKLVDECFDAVERAKCVGEWMGPNANDPCFGQFQSCRIVWNMDTIRGNMCRYIETKTLWIDGQRVGVIKEVKEK